MSPEGCFHNKNVVPKVSFGKAANPQPLHCESILQKAPFHVLQ